MSICIDFIKKGNHIFIVENFIKEKFNSYKENVTCVTVNMQKTLLYQFNLKWKSAFRNKNRFLKDNEEWINDNFFVDFENSNEEPGPSSGNKHGRPYKNFEVTKKRKAIKLSRDFGIDQIQFLEALAIFIDSDLLRDRYQQLINSPKEKRVTVFPAYKKQAKAKNQCYSEESMMEVIETMAKVNLQAL
ncbi:hypothetical protein ABEB36_005756 [Hypothenemus hampei]|uniref:Uncharacterized protein n=1 Tax=Hypothenemus hampei TaxID=57062 RepID=A0ABD1EZR5_HYPHA